MRNLNRLSVIFTRIACLALIVILTIAAALPVFAAGGVDMDRKGDLTLIMVSSDDEETVIGGGTLSLYKVAELTGNPSNPFVFTKDYAGLDVNLNNVGKSKESDIAISKTISLYIKNNRLENTAVARTEVLPTGYAYVNDLEPALYIAVQDEPAEGYCEFLPFMTVIPSYNSKTHSYDYDVVAYPKGISEFPYEDTTSVIPAVTKKVVGKSGPADTEFRFVLKELYSNGVYEIENSSGSVQIGGDVVSQTGTSIEVRTLGEGSAEFGKITFKKTGTYIFEVTEKNTRKAGYVYDNTVYWLKYEVTRDGDSLVVSRTAIKYSDSNGKVIFDGKTVPVEFTFAFVNTYEVTTDSTDTDTTDTETETDSDTTDTDTETVPSSDTESDSETPPVSDETTNPDDSNPDTTTTPESDTPPGPPTNPERLPQTGQIWWPVIVLSIAGFVCVIAGLIVLAKSKRKSSSDDE